MSIGTHWIALYVNDDKIRFFILDFFFTQKITISI